ncbi:hypothetical protein EBU71_16800, partial [bacterium]|nr:hypothetical protein [Candidatus Elulimicrobium humile]
MKILLFGHPRSRSSYLLDVLCQHYNLENLFEYYHFARIDTENKTLFKEPKIIFNNYKKFVKQYTETLFQKDNFAHKLFPGFVSNYYKVNSRLLKTSLHSYSVVEEDFLDLEEYFNLHHSLIENDL